MTRELRDELVEKLTHVINETYTTGRIWQIEGGRAVNGEVEGGTVVNTFKSKPKAAAATGINGQNISNAIRHAHKAGGYHWLVNRDSEEQ